MFFSLYCGKEVKTSTILQSIFFSEQKIHQLLINGYHDKQQKRLPFLLCYSQNSPKNFRLFIKIKNQNTSFQSKKIQSTRLFWDFQMVNFTF